jgi:hypothetical protein
MTNNTVLEKLIGDIADKAAIGSHTKVDAACNAIMAVFSSPEVLQAAGLVKQEQGGMIENHLKKIKALGLRAELTALIEKDRDNILREFMKSDFYQKHKFDFPKSIITHTKMPDELHEWATTPPVNDKPIDV